MSLQNGASRLFLFGCLFAGTAVAAGAFGAHALKATLDPAMLAVFDTATRYQMYHALGLCLVALAMDRRPQQALAPAGWCFAGGILLFSGSLYVVALAGIKWMGAVTPIGGVAFLAGWSLLAWRMWQTMREVARLQS